MSPQDDVHFAYPLLSLTLRHKMSSQSDTASLATLTPLTSHPRGSDQNDHLCPALNVDGNFTLQLPLQKSELYSPNSESYYVSALSCILDPLRLILPQWQVTQYPSDAGSPARACRHDASWKATGDPVMSIRETCTVRDSLRHSMSMY